MSELRLVSRVCPICGQTYLKRPAVSRIDNETLICPDCGIRQALESIRVTDKAQQDHIIELVKDYERRNRE